MYLHILVLSSVLNKSPTVTDSLRDGFPPYTNNGALVKLKKASLVHTGWDADHQGAFGSHEEKYLLGTKPNQCLVRFSK